MGKLTRRSVVFGTGALAGAAGTGFVLNETIPQRVVDSSTGFPEAASANGITVVNDASLLNPTPVGRYLKIGNKPDDTLIAGLRRELQEAKAAGRPFVASAARHSMGGQSLSRDGSVITMAQNWLQADTANGTYRVAAGVRWREVISQLDRIGYSPKVMQSNNNFGVASTFCVNAHGWPVPFSAFGSTVKSLRLMQADGGVITCSRNENTDQFNLAMGGYGLNGVIVDLEVEMVKNRRLLPKFEIFPAVDFGKRFVSALKNDPKIEMAYGRLDVTIDGFFDEALMITYRPEANQLDLPPAQGSGFFSKAARGIFRRQLGSDRVKSLRWYVETQVMPKIAGGDVTRNNLMNEPVITLDDRDPTRTDILHEYFVSPDRFADFIKACQDVIPASYQQLLNITLRFVDTDKEAVLAFASEPRIAAVMLFSQEMSERGEADMARMTSALIERVLAIGGTYYLPYRLHATQAQFERGYPRAVEFAARKRQVDPDMLFRNGLWDRYLAKI